MSIERAELAPQRPEAASGLRPLFVYGTLMHPKVQRAVLGCELDSEPAELAGHRRFGLSEECYPAVVPAAGGTVSGLLVVPSLVQYQLLDAYEGEQYQRAAVVVSTVERDTVDCDCYILRPAHYASLADQPWSYENFCDLYLDDFLA